MRVIDRKPSVAKFVLQDPITLEAITLEDGTEVYWNVVGQDSSEYVQAQKDFMAVMEEMGDEGAKMTSLDYAHHAQIQLSKLVKGWDEKFNDSMGGPYSPEYVVSLLTNPDYKWIYTQLDAFVAVRKNFFGN